MADDDGWDYADPCPVCGHDGRWCRESGDGAVVLCYREESDRQTGSGGWLHYLDDPDPTKRRERLPVALLAATEAAWRDQGYSAILARLNLSAAHRAGLRRRGLTDDAIDRAGYRTMLAQAMVFPRSDIVGGAIPRVPGLSQVRDRGRWLAFLGPFDQGAVVPGALIPVRDPAGRIVHHVLAPDDRTGGKYKWPAGAGVHVHVPLAPELDRRTVRVTEGQLKADVATALSGVLTIGLPGLAWRWARPTLAALGARTVLVAFDSDKATNDAVARAEADLVAFLRSAAYRVEIETWDPAHKGIDDALAAGADIRRSAPLKTATRKRAS